MRSVEQSLANPMSCAIIARIGDGCGLGRFVAPRYPLRFLFASCPAIMGQVQDVLVEKQQRIQGQILSRLRRFVRLMPDNGQLMDE